MNKRDLLLAWEITPASGSNSVQALREEITDWLNRLPDNKECEHIGCVPPNTECDVVTEHIRHGLEWAAKTVRPEWEGKIDEWLKPRNMWEIEVIPEKWEKILTYNGKPLKALIKALFREEMKKLGKDIKAKLLPERYYPDVSMHTRNQTWIDNAIYEALKERVVV